MATMWAQITAIVSAEPGVFALNLALLVCEGIAAGAVAAGIVWESAAENTWKRRISHKLVIWGVVAEVAFSLALFISDEVVSGSQLLEIKEQQSKIIALESPRHLVPSPQFSAIGEAYLAGKKFDLSANPDFEPMMLALEIRHELDSIGMKEQLSLTGTRWTMAGEEMPIGAIIRSGVGVRSCDSNSVAAAPSTSTPARILGGLLADSALSSQDTPIRLEPADATQCSADPDVLHVEIGAKEVLPWQAPPGLKVVYPKLLLDVPTDLPAANTGTPPSR